MIKYLRITMKDKSQYDIPLDLIANNRAMYYAHNDSDDIEDLEDRYIAFTDVFRTEYNITMNDGGDDYYDALDWACNNMNWSDISKYAIRVKDSFINPEFQESWTNGPKKVVEY